MTKESLISSGLTEEQADKVMQEINTNYVAKPVFKNRLQIIKKLFTFRVFVI